MTNPTDQRATQTTVQTVPQGPPLISSMSLDSVRYLGLTTADSVCELVDNSLDARADNIHIHVFEDETHGISLVIEDDGEGIPVNKIAEVLAFGGRTDLPGAGRIGRFGWGLPSSACCQTTHTELYSKSSEGDWHMSYIDLDELKANPEARLPVPHRAAPPENLPLDRAGGTKGTIVYLRGCDQLDVADVQKLQSLLIETVGRTYRRYLSAGRKIWVNGVPVRPSDPLMLLDDCMWLQELGKGQDFVDIEPIVFEDIMDPDTGKPAEVRVRLSLLNWPHMREYIQNTPGMNRNKLTRQHGINPANQGFYLMRNDREIGAAQSLWLYTKHPSLNFFRGEILFPPVLDKLFGVQTNKSRFALNRSLRDKLDQRISGPLAQIKKIAKGWDADESSRSDTGGVKKSEEAAARGEHMLKSNKRVVTPEEIERAEQERAMEKSRRIREVEETPDLSPNVKAERIQAIENEFQFARPFKRVLASIEAGPFYHLRPHGRETEVVINTAHPFYTKVYEKAIENGLDNQLDLILFTLAKAEYMAYDRQQYVLFYETQRAEWSTILKVYLEEFPEDAKE